MPVTHGTPSTYNRGCHCDVCREAHAKRVRESGAQAKWRKRQRDARVEIDGRLVAVEVPPERHGRYATYNAYGCHCLPCTHAASDYAQTTRKRRKP